MKFNISDHLMQKLIRVHENEFDSVLLKNGLEYLRWKSPYEVLQRLQGSNMPTTSEKKKT